MVVHNFIVEDREVEGQTEADGVACSKIFVGNASCLVVEIKGAILDSGKLVS